MNTIRKNVMFTLNAKSYVDTNVPIRYYSRCSLDQLASSMEYYYNSQPSLFDELSVEKVRDMQKQIRSGKYSLSPLQLRVFKTLEELKVVAQPSNHYKICLSGIPIFYCVTIKQEDQLLLLALGGLLNERIVSLNLQKKKCSFGLKALPTTYYSHISSIAEKPISRLYKIDMRLSLNARKKKYLLRKLKRIVVHDKIMQFIKELLYIPIHYQGMDVSHIILDWMPTSSLIYKVLLNYYLIELDRVFYHQVDPSSYTYTRYVNEVIVTTTLNDSESFFECDLYVFFDELDMNGEYESIGPNDNALTSSHGARLSLTKDGDILVIP